MPGTIPGVVLDLVVVGRRMTETMFLCPKCRVFIDGKPVERMLFATQTDLDFHLAAWPGNKKEHQRALQLAHEKADLDQFERHSGADRIVSQVAGIVIELGQKAGFCQICQKHASVRLIDDCWMCEPCWEVWRKKKEVFR